MNISYEVQYVDMEYLREFGLDVTWEDWETYTYVPDKDSAERMKMYLEEKYGKARYLETYPEDV